jgi:hypothetical protein
MSQKNKNKEKAKPTVHWALKTEDESVDPQHREFLDHFYSLEPKKAPEKTPIRELREHFNNYRHYSGQGMRHKKQLYAVPVPIVGKYKDGSNIYRDHHGLYIIHFQAKTRKMVKKHLKTLRRYVKH